ncbi:hypothetical protein OG982_06170 [Streptomyces sp. NBC_01551]|uniref:hypothetical protein n=1 Tax=Streptomyces sp. NBC_01551 TaxID=2975876 RepID=UPI00224F1E38|nr:hypothetical protein [Streptomyces sp. NBC_01551]MCX4525279.1 hypothetical protein [Streptomyces sp. NBC_01551]
MIRIVTASTYAALLADRAALTEALAEVDTVTAARDRALTDLAKDRATGQSLLTQLGQARADVIAADTGMQALVKQITRERDDARAERDAARDAARQGMEPGLADVRADLIRLREHAAGPVNGNALRGALAYGVLRDLIGRVRQERAEAGEEAHLPRPLDVVALVLGLDDGQADEDAAAPVREEAAPAGTQVCAACSTRRPLADFDRGAICLGCPAITASR